MAKIVYSYEILEKHIPNDIHNVKGERSLFDKLIAFIDLAENRAVNTFFGIEAFNSICDLSDDDIIKVAAAKLIVVDAFRNAIPSLDVVFTPNGFAVVGTQNLTPASKQRVDRLVGSMLAQRDDAIRFLLSTLYKVDGWLASEQARFFGQTLFNNIDVVDALNISPGNYKWDKFLEVRQAMIDIELLLACEWLSPQLLVALRREALDRSISGERAAVVSHIKAQIVASLRGEKLNRNRLSDIVNFIRLRESVFPEWHSSEVARLFDPPIFKNDKKAPGYFF